MSHAEFTKRTKRPQVNFHPSVEAAEALEALVVEYGTKTDALNVAILAEAKRIEKKKRQLSKVLALSR